MGDGDGWQRLRRLCSRIAAWLRGRPWSERGSALAAVRIRRSDPPDFHAAYHRMSGELQRQRVALERRNRELAELNELGALVASSLEREEVLRRIVLAGQRLLGAGMVRLWLLDRSGQRLELVAGAGPADGLPGTMRVVPLEGSVYGQVVREGRPFRSDDVLAEPSFMNRAFVERTGLRACIAVPLRQEGESLGVLSVLARREHRFRAEDVDLLTTLAGYAALALTNAALAEEVGRLEGLRELDRLKAEFLSTISHELRTPLSLIHGYAELLALREVPSGQVREMASEILRGSSRMVRMVDELLDFSGLETGRLALHMARTDLGALLAEVSRELVGSSPKHALRLEVAPDLPPVSADPERLRQVVVHLVRNALQYSPRGGEIAVTAGARVNRVLVSVADRGVGIAPDEQERVFEKFYRARDALVSSVRGAGLGLAVARHVLAAHGGAIELRSTRGEGSVFTFWLPLAPGEPPSEAATGEATGSARTTQRIAG